MVEGNKVGNAMRALSRTLSEQGLTIKESVDAVCWLLGAMAMDSKHPDKFCTLVEETIESFVIALGVQRRQREAEELHE